MNNAMTKLNIDRSGSTKLNYLAAVAVCMAPIFAPYKFMGPISIANAFLIIISLLIIVSQKKIVIHVPLFFLVIIHAGLSFLAFYTLEYNTGLLSMLRSIIMTFIISLSFMQLIPFYEKKSFFHVLSTISIICGSFLLFQFLNINRGIIPYDGRLFEGLVEGYTWSASVTYRRVNSFFSEPSYFAIYFLPVMALMLMREKKVSAVICWLLLFISTSTLGVLGSSILILGYTLFEKKAKGLVLLTLGLITVVLVLKTMDLSWFMKFNLDKINNLSENSQIRIVGYLEYFKELPIINQLIGVGFFQLSNYFRSYGLFNYSNAFILILINHGILGLMAFFLFLLSLFKKNNMKGRVFLLIFIMISAIDSFIYSSNFYYVLYFAIVFSDSKSMKQIRII
ncbi:hypothetical protein [Paenibacillus odorifer]|uniref:Polysaccharide polymerase n=1 Tax=Paenibacillus odorifer TaxID=189426 RepID=A0A1R0XS80_9BACL|nr:hypothetical protein [Paenibacillus odorifer]OMD37950.1 hypothetical protein BSK52_20330 [Paenibacillus odorifer]